MTTLGSKVRVLCQEQCCRLYRGLVGEVISLISRDNWIIVAFNDSCQYAGPTSLFVLVEEKLPIPNSNYQYCSFNCGSITINKNQIQTKYICCQCKEQEQRCPS